MEPTLLKNSISSQAYWQRLYMEKYQSINKALHGGIFDVHVTRALGLEKTFDIAYSVVARRDNIETFDMEKRFKTTGCEQFEHLQKGI